jgi:hypothetical protein
MGNSHTRIQALAAASTVILEWRDDIINSAREHRPMKGDKDPKRLIAGLRANEIPLIYRVDAKCTAWGERITQSRELWQGRDTDHDFRHAAMKDRQTTLDMLYLLYKHMISSVASDHKKDAAMLILYPSSKTGEETEESFQVTEGGTNEIQTEGIPTSGCYNDRCRPKC